jgi:hypothetical protein
MKHSIVIWKRLKVPNEQGKRNYSIKYRYDLTQEDIEKHQTEVVNESIDPESEYEYYAEIEETTH